MYNYILRAGARCRRPPCRDRQGWCTDWLARSGWQKFAEGREKGGRREEEGRQEQGRGREEEGGREERGTFLWSLGSRGVPWELSSGAWVVSGGPRGFQGCSLGTPGGCLGGLGLSPGGLGMSFGVRWCPWSQNGRFWGPLLGAPGRHVCCRKGNGRQSRKQANMFARRPKRTILGTSF